MYINQIIGENYKKLIDRLHVVFGDDLADIQTTREWFKGCDMQSDQVYQRLKGTGPEDGMTDDLTKAMFRRDPLVWTNNNYSAVTFINMLHVKDVYHRLRDREIPEIWTMIHNILQYYIIIRATGGSLGKWETIARAFIEMNPDLPRHEYPQALLAQLFNNGPLSQLLYDALDDTDALTGILKNIGPLLAGMGMSDHDGNGTTYDTTQQKEELHWLKCQGNSASNVKKRERLNKAIKISEARHLDPVAQMVESLSKLEVGKKDMEELRSTLQANVTGTSNATHSNMATMVQTVGAMMGSGDAKGFDSLFMADLFGGSGFSVGQNSTHNDHIQQG